MLVPCMNALLQQPAIRRRLARTAGLGDLDSGTTARLSVLGALHDIGKANVGFQAQIWGPQDLVGQRLPCRAGHTTDLIPVLTGSDAQTCKWFMEGLGLSEEILCWGNDDGYTACAMLLAALSHHGTPLNAQSAKQPNPAIWRPLGELSPKGFVRRAGRMIRAWFPRCICARCLTAPVQN